MARPRIIHLVVVVWSVLPAEARPTSEDGLLVGGHFNPSRVHSPTSSEDCERLHEEWQVRLRRLSIEMTACDERITRMCGDTNTNCWFRHGMKLVTAYETRCTFGGTHSEYPNFPACKPSAQALACARDEREIAIKECSEALRGYLREEEERRRKEQEEERARSTQKEENSGSREAGSGESGRRDAARDAARQEAARQEALKRADEAMREQLVTESAMRSVAAAKHRDEAQAAKARLEEQASAIGATTASLADRIVAMVTPEPSGGYQLAYDLTALIGEGRSSSDGGRSSTEAIVRTLDLEAALLPMASIPLQFVRHILLQQERLVENVTSAIGDFERLDARFADRDVVTEFGERAFSPRAFLSIVVAHSASPYIDRRLGDAIEPLGRTLTYRAQRAIDQRHFSALYEVYEPPVPNPQVRHWWSLKPSTQRTDLSRDAAGAPRLFKDGAPFRFDPSTGRNTFTPQEMELIVAAGDADVKRLSPERWEYSAVVFTPVQGEVGWVAASGASWAIDLLREAVTGPHSARLREVVGGTTARK